MVSTYIQELLTAKSRDPHADLPADSETVVVHPIAQKAAMFYERLRGLLDYQEEVQLRRRIIERIIKRKFLFKDGETAGKSILSELVGAGYLPNDVIPEHVASAIQIIVDRYKNAYEELADPPKGFNAWTTSMAAVEVNELLFPHPHEEAAYRMFVSIIKDKLVLDVKLSPERLERLAMLAAARVLLEASLEEQSHLLWKRVSPATAMETEAMISFFKRSEAYLADPLVWTVATKVKDIGVSVKLLEQFAEEYAGAAMDALEDHKMLTERLAAYLSKHYKEEQQYVKKSGTRAIIYLLCTKVVLALIIEVPLDLWLSGSIAFFALAVNIAFHPLLLLMLTRKNLGFSADNSRKAIGKTLTIVDGTIETIHVKTKTNASYEMIFLFLYGLMYVVVFSVIIGVLYAIGFNPISTMLFLVFLALVSYFAVRIRSHALRWRVWTGKERIVTTLGNLFMLPIIRLGRWLSVKFSSINALVFIMDFIVETPFKMIVELSNNFLHFLQDKREDVF